MNLHSIYCGNGELHHSGRLGICHRRGTCPRSQRSRYERQERLQWRERNQNVIKRLAQMVGAWPQDIDDFLYDLTLQKYSHLLNPKECGWNFCKVPLCYPNICDRYMGIFDRLGDLRDPTHPKCQHHLLQLLQDHLNGACHDVCLDLPIHAQYPGGRRVRYRRFRKLSMNFHEPDIMDMVSTTEEHFRSSSFVSSLGHPFLLKRKPILAREVKPMDVDSNSPRMSVEGPYSIRFEDTALEMRPRVQVKRTLGRHSVFLNDELALAHDRPFHFIEDLLKEAVRRPQERASYVGPIGALRVERLCVLIKQLIEKKGRNIEPRELKKIIEKFNFGNQIEKKRQKQIANEVSRMYGSIVDTTLKTSKRPKRSIGSIPIHEPRELTRPFRSVTGLNPKHVRHQRSMGSRPTLEVHQR